MPVGVFADAPLVEGAGILVVGVALGAPGSMAAFASPGFLEGVPGLGHEGYWGSRRMLTGIGFVYGRVVMQWSFSVNAKYRIEGGQDGAQAGPFDYEV